MRGVGFLFFLVSALLPASADAAVEVHFDGGRSLLAQSVETRGEMALLVLPGGGRLALERGRISRVVELPAEPERPVPPAQEEGVKEAGAAPKQALADELLAPLLGPVDGGYGELIRSAALRHDLDAELLRCVLLVESGFDPEAVSPKGAQGLAQLMPSTARELGVQDPFDPAEAVDAAARLLRSLLDESGGRFVQALAAYNAGRGAVSRWGGVPPYGETVRYVEKVLSLYHAR